ncbi:MAG: molybdopterin molybdenumtransferase MoeA, partial [Pseudomonadota bacterium]
GGLVAEGNRAFWRIAMRPGKPLLFGRSAAAPLLGLPGNPVSAVVCGALFLHTAIRRMLGRTPDAPPLTDATLAAPLPAGGGRETYLRARYAPTADGARGVAALDRQDSAQFSALAASDALIRQPIDAAPRPAGATVEILPLDFD